MRFLYIMFGISGFEFFIIVVAIFLLFGPDKLPEFIKVAGVCIKKFRAAKAEMDSVLHEEIINPVMKEANKPDDANESSNKATRKKSDNTSEDKKNSQFVKSNADSSKDSVANMQYDNAKEPESTVNTNIYDKESKNIVNVKSESKVSSDIKRQINFIGDR